VKHITRGLVLSAIAVVLCSIPLLAHHGGASFDNTKEVTVKGSVTEWLWANPHCFLKVEVKDETGTARVWNLELGNPTDIASRGFQRRTFKPGDQVTAVVTPVKSGAPVGRLKTVTLADGRTL
jgi:hypothetical protein